MDLDSDTLYLGTSGRSFTSYATREREREREQEQEREREREKEKVRERDILYEKYSSKKYLDRYSASGILSDVGTATRGLYGSAARTDPLDLPTKSSSSALLASSSNRALSKTTTTNLGTSTVAAQPPDRLLLSSIATNLAATTYGSCLDHSTNQQQQQQQQVGSRAQSSLGQNQQLLQQLFEDMRQIEDTVDSIEIPARGRCRVYMAKYGYDPFKQSPNENPDAELAFNAGDYIMVFDDVDEDGYFIGELLDGRRGYVPSNWLDRLTGEDLFEFQASTLYKSKEGDALDSGTSVIGAGTLDAPGADGYAPAGSYPPEFYDAILSDTKSHSNFQHLLAPEHYHRMNDYVDLDDVNEVDDECLSDYERAEAEQMRRAVPPPQRLALERQLNKSILIAWLHPQAAKGTIVSYQVYVDGVLKSTVPSGDRTKALLEGVDSTIPHRISVRAIDLQGRHSNDAGCTIVIGTKVPFAPSCVKASHITSDSALISWLPANSNFHHVVAVNSVEVQTMKPGVYKHLINGLSANTLYRVWVRAKPGKILSIDEKNPKKLEFLTTYVDFTTMPKSLPDPPVNVQVEAGPQRRTLLITWLPLTLNDFGSSNGCAVTGYAVFAGHKKLADIDSPTGDHALLDLSDLESLHKKSVTVRTKSGENLSQDSMPCHIPDEYLKAATTTNLSSRQHHEYSSQHHHHHHHSQHHQSSIRHGSATALHQHRQFTDEHGRYSPARVGGGRSGDYYANSSIAASGPQARMSRYGRQLSSAGRSHIKSMQNLESDLDSRSSLPTIDITTRASNPGENATGAGPDHLINQHTESYSEEEFESSMRFRGSGSRATGKARSGNSLRYRTRQSHSVDSGSAIPAQHHLINSSSNRAYPTGMRPTFGGIRTNNQLDRDNSTRYFVAMFDYDPSTMSPNPNAASEELAFKEGSIIKVIGDKGPDGFYKGELDNHIGFVPCNVVSEITDTNLIFNLQQQKKNNINNSLTPAGIMTRQTSMQPNSNNNINISGGSLNQIHMQQQQQQQQQPQQQRPQQPPQQQIESDVKRMTALYDYDPQENSPNADTESEIPFKVGDVIYVYGKMDTDGFYMGEVERTKQRGLVPSNFLRESPLPAVSNLTKQQSNFVQQQPEQMPLSVQMVPQTLDQSTQQQRANVSSNQFIANSVQQQQMDSAGGANFGNGPILSNHLNQMRPTIGMIGNQQQQVLRAPMLSNQRLEGPLSIQAVQQQNINRPNSLSWGNPTNNSQTDWSNNARNQQLQLAQNQNQLQFQNRVEGGQHPSLQQQQAMMVGGQFGGANGSNILHLGQQQQQPGGGVLSNLLSSGKQIIGAATTPRAPNQPSQFPSMNSNSLNSNNINQPLVMNSGNSALVTDPQIHLTTYNNNSNPNNNQQLLQRGGNQLLSQQTGAIGGNFNQVSAQSINNNPFPLTMNQQQINPPQLHNAINTNNQLSGQQQHQQQINRGPLGEEQGGNILNTVKNMFKL